MAQHLSPEKPNNGAHLKDYCVKNAYSLLPSRLFFVLKK